MEAVYVARSARKACVLRLCRGRNLELLATSPAATSSARVRREDYVERGVDVIVVRRHPAPRRQGGYQTRKDLGGQARVSDPIATGLVDSVGAPRESDGMSMIGPDLSGKRLGFPAGTRCPISGRSRSSAGRATRTTRRSSPAFSGG